MIWLADHPVLADVVGLAGSALMVVAYAYSTLARRIDLIWFNLLNLIGAIMLFSSLTVHFNLPSILLEAIWAAIASFGLVKAWRARKQA